MAEDILKHIAKDTLFLIEELERVNREKQLILDALLIASQYARNNLPAEIPWDDEHVNDYITIIAGGNHRDPEGKEFTALWLQMAKEKNLF